MAIIHQAGKADFLRFDARFLRFEHDILARRIYSSLVSS